MFHQLDLFDIANMGPDAPAAPLNLPGLIGRIADVSPQPRYTFMALNAIAKAARNNSGSAGPYVIQDDRRISLRDWLCDD